MNPTNTTQTPFNPVRYIREQRERIHSELKDMTHHQQLEYFRQKSAAFRKMLATAHA